MTTRDGYSPTFNPARIMTEMWSDRYNGLLRVMA